MEKRALHEVVKKAAHNAWLLRKAAEDRDLRVKAIVKTAAVAALRKQDLKGAILARVNGEKVAARLKLPNKIFTRGGQFLTELGRPGGGLRSALAKSRGVMGRAISSHGGLLGAARHGARLIGRDMLELGRRGYGGARRRAGEFFGDVSGNRLSNFLGEAGFSNGTGRGFIERGKRLLSEARDPSLLAEQDRRVIDLVKNTLKGNSDGVERTYRNAQARTAARLKAKMLRARMQAGAAAGAAGLGSYALSDGPDYDPYRYS